MESKLGELKVMLKMEASEVNRLFTAEGAEDAEGEQIKIISDSKSKILVVGQIENQDEKEKRTKHPRRDTK